MQVAASGEQPLVASAEHRVRGIVADILIKSQRCATFSAGETLADIGLTSVDMISLLLDIEREFDLEIPHREITPETFHSVPTIAALVARLAPAKQTAAPAACW